MTKTLHEPTETITPGTEGLSVSKRSRFKQFIGTKKGKILSIVTLVVVLLVVLLAVPMTRYGIAGAFIKKDVMITVVDSTTKKPVTEAAVTLGAVSSKTDSKGMAHLSDVPVGSYTLKIEKNYYELTETSYTVPILSSPQEAQLEVKATGRQVTVNLVNTITQKPLAKATIKAHDTSAVTDDKGNAVIVLPADKETVKGMVSLEGYNQQDITIKVTEQEDANKFSLTPSGTIFYLSKQTGKINVMKSNLDGSNPQVVVEATGNESDQTTVLLAARDWRYLALSADRTGSGNEQLYLIDSTSGSLKVIDEGDANFQLVGWSDHKFVYTLTRNNKESWEDKRQALKMYNAETGQLNTVDETIGAGTNYYDSQFEQLLRPYILDGKLVYAKFWQVGNTTETSDKKSAIILVNTHSEQKQTIKEFSMQNTISIDSKLYEPQEVYFRVTTDGSEPVFYEYEGGSVKSVTNTDDKFYNTFYPTYLVSPSGEKTFWFEPRDGKNALFVGDKNGSNSTELALQSEYSAYGWFSDEYVLLSKNDSELYIAPSDSLANDPIKVTNYHKPTLTFPGYGYGYGGQ